MTDQITRAHSKKAHKEGFHTKDLVLIPLFSVIIIICSYICIPVAIPFTMQTFAVFFALLMLGGKKGTASIIIYLLLGVFGLPVFSQGRGGIGILFGTTGGFLLGFLLTGFFYILMETILCVVIKKKNPNPSLNTINEAITKKSLWIQKRTEQILLGTALIIGLALCYLFGALWFYYLYTKTSAITIPGVLGLCVTPFILPDLLKLILALILTSRLRRYLN